MIKSQLKMQRQNKEKIKISRSIQDTIPVDTVYSDGIFRMKNRFSKTYRILERQTLEKLAFIDQKKPHFNP